MSEPTPTPTPTRGVVVMLDKERRLRYTLGTMRKIREEFGADAVEKGFATDELSRLFLYGLKHEDPKLTLEDVEEMVDGENLKTLTDAMVAAFGQKNVDPLLAIPKATEGVADGSPSPQETKT